MNNFESKNNKEFLKIYRYIQKQDLTKLHKFIVKKSNKNVKKRNKKHKINEFIRKNLTSRYKRKKDLRNFFDKNNWQQYCTYNNIGKIDIVNRKNIDKWNIEELKEMYLLLQDVCLKAGDLLIEYQKQLNLSDKVIDKRNEEIVGVAGNNIKLREEIKILKNKEVLIKRYFKKSDLIKKQERIIDLMAEQLAGLAIFDNDIENALILGDKEEVKNYYERKATNGE